MPVLPNTYIFRRCMIHSKHIKKYILGHVKFFTKLFSLLNILIYLNLNNVDFKYTNIHYDLQNKQKIILKLKVLPYVVSNM